MSRTSLTKNWVELQEQLSWLSSGVEIGAIDLNEYFVAVRAHIDDYEFMAKGGKRGS